MARPFVLKIELPQGIATLVAAESSISGPLHSAVADFSVWLSDNKTPFFYEYTDHGIAHVNNVLRSVESLIPSAVWGLLTPEDGAAMVAAVLLHDCAMHLSTEGFFDLIESVEDERISAIYPKENSWSVEYAKFEQEAGRWDAEKLISVFGDSEPAVLLGPSKTLSDRQKMLVGEFLRRNHARLAHEIAINGVPGSDRENRFAPFSRMGLELQDFIGFLARSHNMGIREAADMIPRIRRRRYMDVHAPYVMALLRIADYIQIDSARAPTQILQLRGLKSPLSRHEWAKHHAVLELNQLGDDPEALNVIADPKSVQIFCGLRGLFKDLQRELDESWALLGEIYGRVENLKVLGLTVRRLISNLDDVEEFERVGKPPYIPREIRLTTASAELLHLLVGPLYGNRPSVGVRELLQNSIDATLERESYCAIHDSPVEETIEPAIEVEVDVSTPGARFLRITDNGVGMTIDTLEGFFLRAGASFRQSQWWRNEYVTELNDSKVRRSGRFGVGALAAFLIGPTITIVTRHFLDDSGVGLKLDIALDNGIVQISRVPAAIGTSISVRISDDAIAASLLNPPVEETGFSDWYVYSRPVVKYRVHKDGEWKERVRRLVLQEPVVDKERQWVEVQSDDFEGIYWSYEHSRPSSTYSTKRYLSCNGIFVTSVPYGTAVPEIIISSENGPFSVEHPTLLVNDKNGRLPLNVQRSGMVDREYPFQSQLTESIADVYARDVYLALSVDPNPVNFPAVVRDLRSRLRKYGTHGRHQLVGLSRKGWVPLERRILGRGVPRAVVMEVVNVTNFDGVLLRLPIDEKVDELRVPFIVDGQSMGVMIAFIRSVMEGEAWGYESPIRPYQALISGMRLFIREDIVEGAQKRGGLPLFLWRQLTVVHCGGGWSVYEVGNPLPHRGPFDDFIAIADSARSRIIAYCYLDDGELVASDEAAHSSFSRAWLSITGTGYVPPRGK